MKNITKLTLASLFLLCSVEHAIGQMMLFNITNEYGKVLHVNVLDSTGNVLQEPTPVNPGDNLSLVTIPQVVEAFYPEIENSKCGLVFKPEELKNKVVYLRVRPMKNKVRFIPLPGLKNNIYIKSIREAKEVYKDWSEKQGEKK